MAKNPNIILILVDDMGYGDFSAFNNGLSRTPVLDNLIGESVCFTQAYTASPVCNPSRAALLTGRYPHRTGSIDTLEWRGLERLALRETTVADILKNAGYTTGLIGKWHLGAFDKRYHPLARGFDEAICFRGGMHDYYRWRLEYGHTVRRADGRYLTDVWTEEAIRFIERNRQQPFFLHLTYNAPHTPLQAPEENVTPFTRTGQFNTGVSILYGMIHRMDSGVGRILEALEHFGITENTIVMFSSDNGPQFSGPKYGNGADLDLTRFNCGFNGAKGSVYEGGIRVPMIIRWPDGLDGGREVREMVHFCDWFATILAMAQVDMPSTNLPIDGVNFLPMLQGESLEYVSQRFWQWNRYTPLKTCNAAMRDGDWKIVRPSIDAALHVPMNDFKWLPVSMYGPEHFINQGLIAEAEPQREVKAVPPPELYNVAEDPLEKENLAGSEPDRVNRMLSELDTWFEEVERERATIDDQW